MPLLPRHDLRWGQQRRLEFIDRKLCWDEKLNRADLCETFAISVPQASVDIARYSELAPDNLAYDRGSRSYFAGPKYKPVFPATNAAQFLQRRLWAETSEQDDRAMQTHGVPIVTMPMPARSIALSVLRPLWRAIRERAGVRVIYQSLSKPEAQLRTLSPHALAHDGFRWHARAYCHTRRDFRDFVIARVLEIKGPAPAGASADDDVAWNTLLTLKLAPHPRLNPAHRRAIELDYGMVKGQVGLPCRKAMLFYALHHLRLDERASNTPEASQIVLKNAEQIVAAMGRRSPV